MSTAFSPFLRWPLRLFQAGGWLFLVLTWLLALLAVAAWVAQSTWVRQERQISPPGKMYLVEGEWLHLDCRGPKNAPLWVLEAGAMGWSSVWEWVLIDGARDRRVCAWDRPGMGWSRPSSRDPSAAASARLLKGLLTQAGLSDRRFVMVGHSLGGMYALSYAKLYPGDLSALVLLDPAHPQQLWRLPETSTRRTLGQVDTLAQALPLFDFGGGRAFVTWRTESSLHRLPPSTLPALVHVISQRGHLDRAVQEYRAWPQSSRQSRPSTLGDLPLLVISASDREHGNRPSNLAWWELHRGLAQLSSHGRWEIVPGTAHQSLIMKEAAAYEVAARIRAMEAAFPPDQRERLPRR